MLPRPDVPRLDFTARISRSISADRFCCLLIRFTEFYPILILAGQQAAAA
jgi:hypothetical protein